MNPVGLGISLPMAGQGLSAGELLHELTAEVQAAERVGLDLVAVPEHHSGPRGSLTEPLTTVTWLLAKTSRIRVATGVLLLPLHSAARVAEQGAILQHASGGRLVVGIGAGYQTEDFALFGVDRRQRTARLEDGLGMLRLAWSGEVVNGVRVLPALEPAAVPPTWLGAWSTPGVQRAADMADGWIADPIRSVDEIEAMAHRYAEALSGREGHVVVMREGWVGESDDDARAVYGPVVEPIYRYYLRSGAFPADTELTEADLTLDGVLADRVVVGSPESVAKRLADIAVRTGASTLLLALRHPSGPPHRAVLEAIELLGKRVKPLLDDLIQNRRTA